ncbi:MAG: hypothetical protein HYT03_02090 [Candidatus Harrisonbacteria bacterium]|nr:hypothetical protein [Candidatus Harrisonbacteria bacterium]
MSENLERFFTDYLQRSIIKLDKEIGRLESLRDKGSIYDPEDLKLLLTKVIREDELRPIEEQVIFLKGAIQDKARLLKLWPFFIKQAVVWNPEIELDLRIENMDIPVGEFLDLINSHDPHMNMIIYLTEEIINIGYDILEELNENTIQGVKEKMSVVQRAFTIVKNSRSFYAVSTINDLLAQTIEKLENDYIQLRYHYSIRMDSIDAENDMLQCKGD